jgi:hypothetical protein
MKKVNPWKLAVIFLGLVVVFLAIKKFRSPGLESNLPRTVVEIDTARVTDLLITPAKGNRETVRITRSGGWKLMKGEQTLRLEQGAAASALRMLTSLKPDRLATKRKEKWNEFSVGDSTGTRIQVMAGTSTLADLVIGRSGFGQSATGSYGGPGFTYVRLTDEPEVFTVDGFLDAHFNRPLDDWRDKSFLRLSKDSVDRMRFSYQGDSSFVIDKQSGKWMMSNTFADSTAILSYLSGMAYKNATAFAPAAPAGAPGATVIFEKSSKAVATVEAWPEGADWTVRSSHQPETFFRFDAAAVKDFFAGKKRFMPVKSK